MDAADGAQDLSEHREVARQSAALGADHGLYNGFLVAGFYGGLTVSKRILYAQALPALGGAVIAPGRGDHQTRFTPYFANAGSAVATVSSSSRAWATRRRSKGSR